MTEDEKHALDKIIEEIEKKSSEEVSEYLWDNSPTFRKTLIDKVDNCENYWKEV